MFFRRTVPAMAVTFGIYIGLDVLTWLFLRKHYLPPVVGWLLALSVLCAAACVWLVRRRAA
jgi:hypothetical protein